MHPVRISAVEGPPLAPRRSMWMDWILPFLLAFFMAFRVNVVGTLPVTELILLALAPYFLLARNWLQVAGVKRILMLGALWLVSQSVSDVMNDIDMESRLKGVANIGFVLLNFSVYTSLLFDRPKRILPYLVGAVAGGCFHAFSGGRMTIEQGWQGNEFWDIFVAGWASPLTMLVSYFLFRKRPTIVVALFLLYGITAVAMGARAHGFVMMVAAGVLHFYAHGSAQRIYFNRTVMFKLIAVGVPALAVVYGAYIHFGLRGDLNEKTRRQLLLVENPYNPIEVVRHGRGAFFVALEAIKDKPVFGHGSKANSPKYRIEGFASSEIPTHSVVLGAWTFGGVAGGIFWIYVLAVFVRALLVFLRTPGLTLMPLYASAIVLAFWAVLFSPMGYARFTWPVDMALCIVVAHRAGMQAKLTKRLMHANRVGHKLSRKTRMA